MSVEEIVGIAHDYVKKRASYEDAKLLSNVLSRVLLEIEEGNEGTDQYERSIQLLNELTRKSKYKNFFNSIDFIDKFHKIYVALLKKADDTKLIRLGLRILSNLLRSCRVQEKNNMLLTYNGYVDSQEDVIKTLIKPVLKNPLGFSGDEMSLRISIFESILNDCFKNSSNFKVDMIIDIILENVNVNNMSTVVQFLKIIVGGLEDEDLILKCIMRIIKFCDEEDEGECVRESKKLANSINPEYSNKFCENLISVIKNDHKMNERKQWICFIVIDIASDLIEKDPTLSAFSEAIDIFNNNEE